jgi:hypothetical protein
MTRRASIPAPRPRQIDITRALKAAKAAGVRAEVILPGGLVVREIPAIPNATPVEPEPEIIL